MVKKISTQILTLMALCIVLNIVGGHLALYLHLVIYLDTIGTILSAALLGPVAALIVGFLTALINGLTGDLFSIYYMPSQLIVALVAGVMFRRISIQNKKSLWWLAFIISLPATIVSTVITVILFHGITSSGSSSLVQIMSGFGMNQALAVFLVQVGTDYIDRLIGIYIVAVIYIIMKKRMMIHR